MLKIYNTLTNKKEVFKPIQTGKVKMYTCGPTVYDYAHIGNLCAYIHADTLRRYLDVIGYEVLHIVNITDVGHLTEDDLNQADSGEDKMLKAALRENKTSEEIANFYTNQFFKDVKDLNITKANYYPRATAHIDQMIKIIENLIQKGLAYEKNGNVFYDVEKFAEYGKLSNKKLEDLKHGARLEDHPDKKHSYDFALWLKAPKKHILKWESPWSLGYPGWHIECSAMSMEYLGETLDIHTGGEDHVFPHHENEIAQSEGCTGKSFANFWFHNRFLLVDSQKMSKSKGNFYTLQDITEKGFTPAEFRMLVISSHYRSSLNFTWEGMEQAKKNLEKISKFIQKAEKLAGSESTEKGKVDSGQYAQIKQKIIEALDNDLNTPSALSFVFELISETKNPTLSSDEAKEILALWEKINKVFGLKLNKAKTLQIPEEITKLLTERDLARENKDFESADKLREAIEEKGYLIEDSSSGSTVHKK